MKRGSRQLIALGAVALVLGGVYAGLTVWTGYRESKEEQKAQEAEEAARIYLCQAKNPAWLEVQNENGTFSFTYDEETEMWAYDRDEHFPVLQSKITSIAAKVESLEAVRWLDGADEDLSVYGLDEPVYTLTVLEGDNNPVTIYVGDASEASGDYYVKLADDEKIYTAASVFANTLGISEDTILQTETFPSIASSAVTALTWKADGEEKTVRLETREVEPETTEPELETESDIEAESDAEPQSEKESEGEPETESYWLFEDSGEIEDTAALDELLTLIGELEYTDCADYYMEEDEAGLYGLSEGCAEFVISYTQSDEKKEAVIKIGGLTEDETDFYVIVDDSTMVNTLSAESIVWIRSFFE